MPPWSPYKIVLPKGSEPGKGEGQILETVYHVAHVAGARRILEDGQLKAGLVYDESVLKKSRISVTWLSANIWSRGSIYGNVQFAFPWSDLIAERHFYWVEPITTYSPPAYRILLTDRDLTHSKYVIPYDPSSAKGPLREDGGVWYWNATYTSEFMIEGDITLDDCTGLDFITHHYDICRPYGSNCPDRSSVPESIGSRVLAFLLGNNCHSIDHVLRQTSRSEPTRRLGDAVDRGISGISRILGKTDNQFCGGIKSKASRKAVLRGALALYGMGQLNAARELLMLISSRSVFETALTELVDDHFNITGWPLPD